MHCCGGKDHVASYPIGRGECFHGSEGLFFVFTEPLNVRSYLFIYLFMYLKALLRAVFVCLRIGGGVTVMNFKENGRKRGSLIGICPEKPKNTTKEAKGTSALLLYPVCSPLRCGPRL